MRILIIDDEEELCLALADFFNVRNEFHAIPLKDSREAIDRIKKDRIDLVISDVRMPHFSGIEIAQQIKKEKIHVPIILISGQEDVINSINALDLGIYDFLIKPLDMKKLLEMVRAISEESQNKLQLAAFYQSIEQAVINLDSLTIPSSLFRQDAFLGTVVLASDFMKTLVKKIRKIALFPNIPVLIQGPTGTGKEVVARMIHYFSNHRGEAYVPVNCAAIEKNLFESELFGYTKGAFTGADAKGRDGKIKAAQGGTLFLDEITEISLDLQTKLLRVLQEKEYYPLGSNTPEKVDTHIICATNQDIEKLVKNDQFRQDLFYRLDVCKLTLLPLSERRNEIPFQSLMFIKEIIRTHDLPIKKIRGEVIDLLVKYHWPGNVRQLKNTLTKAMLFCETDTLVPQDFSFLDTQTEIKSLSFDPHDFQIPEKAFSLEQFGDDILYRVLEKFQGNKSKAAEFLGLERHQLYYRYKKVVERFDKDNSTG